MDQSDEMGKEPLKISKELLEKRAYERSYVWAQFLDKVSAAEDSGDICFDFAEDYYGKDDDKNNYSDFEHMAEEVDTSDEENLNDSGQNAIEIALNLTNSNANGLLAEMHKKSNESGIIGTEVQRVLEETLPVVEEYTRNWLQAGFERFLKTFDIEVINEKVGNWILRNNSFAFQSLPLPFKERFQPYQLPRTKLTRELKFEETDSDSLHSDDTARYIRSSRKHLSMKKRVATTTTTIRSYRLVESKRDELRKKYAYLVPDDTMLNLKKKHYRQIATDCHVWPEYMAEKKCHRVNKLCIDSGSHRIRRRRHRRRCSSPYTSYSSTDEEITLKGKTFLKPLCCKREKCYSYRTLQSSRTKYLQNHDISNEYEDELLPYMNETECACRGSNKLCSNARHFANSSTEDWLVENCENSTIILPKKEETRAEQKSRRDVQDISTSKNRKKTQKFMREDSNKALKSRTEKNNTKKKYAKSKQPTEQESYKDNPKSEETTSKSKKSKRSNSKTSNVKSKQTPKKESFNNSFDAVELQKAIELSKQQYEEEQKNKIKSHLACSTQSMICAESESLTNQSAEESHTASKLASQLSSDLQLDDQKHKNKCKSSLKLKSTNKLASTSLQDKKLNNFNIQAEKCESNLTNSQTSNDIQRKMNIQTNSQALNGQVEPNLNNLSKKSNTNNIPIVISSSSSETESVRPMHKKTNKKQQTLMSIQEIESESEDNNAIEMIKKQNNEKSCQNSTKNILSENTTFFANSGNICNSTAVTNNTAIKRQMLFNKATPTARVIATKKTKISEATKKHTKTKKIQTKENSDSKSNDTEKKLPVNNAIKNNIDSSQISDCTTISSTTNSDLQQQTTIIPNIVRKPAENRIVLYTPKNASFAPNDSIVNGRFKVTEPHLATVIGEKRASKFMKYYVGPREFLQSSTVYYKPPKQEIESDSSDSDIDFIDLCNRYGGLDESKESKQHK